MPPGSQAAGQVSAREAHLLAPARLDAEPGEFDCSSVCPAFGVPADSRGYDAADDCLHAEPRSMMVRTPRIGSHSVAWGILAAVEIGVIFWASSRPSPVFTSSDLIDTLIRKSGHIAEFALLGALGWLALRAWLRPNAAVRAAFVLATGYAIFDELHQVFTLTRRPSPVDVAIDAAGAAVGIVAVKWLVRRGDRRGAGRGAGRRRR